MLRTRRRRLIAALVAGGTLAAGASFVSPGANAAVCAEVRVYVAGSATPVGTCVPFMDQWIENCAGANVFPLGYGAGATGCAPTPV